MLPEKQAGILQQRENIWADSWSKKTKILYKIEIEGKPSNYSDERSFKHEPWLLKARRTTSQGQGQFEAD